MSEPEDQPINPATIRHAAMDYLARREHCRRELQQKLQKRFEDVDLIDEQLDRLAEENLQSDSRYAESFVRQRFNRGYGPLRICQELRQKEIGDEEIRMLLASEDYDWTARAEAVLDRKYGGLPAADIKEKARRSRFMQYRGFHEEHFRAVI